jgi:hypothetical protein
MTTHVLAVAAATVAAFALSAVWYGTLSGVLGRLSPAYADGGTKRPERIPLEVLRCAVVATVLALACARMDLTGPGAALPLALLAWAGFPLVLLTGSVLHERVPWRLAAVHAGDWLIKLVAVTLIVGLWR